MDFILIFLLFSSPALFITFIVLTICGYYYVALPFLLTTVFSALIGLLGFRLSVVSRLKKLNSEHFSLSKKISNYLSSGKKTVLVEKDVVWKCVGFGPDVTFNLRGFVFKKAFITAFIVRALRYRIVSDQLPHRFIGRFRLKGVGKSLTAFVEFKSKKRIQKVLLANNNVSKTTFMSWFIIWVCSPSGKAYRHWRIREDGLVVGHYNEEMFCRSFNAKI